MAAGSTRVVLIAMAANATIAVAKFAAFAMTGSSAMLSEAVHSVADTSNQGLLLLGTHRARRRPDAQHPFGYSKELYFWSFIVAILLFGLGAGVSIYEGVAKILDPHPIENAEFNYVVLGFAILLEGASTIAAVREFNKRRAKRAFVPALRGSKDPALFTILLEDIAAVTGLTVALVGIAAADLGGYEPADGIASIVIGLILAYVATFLAIEVKGLLIGEAASPEVRYGIRKLIAEEADRMGRIHNLNEIRTMQLGANDILVAASVDIDDQATAADIKEMTRRLETVIRDAYPDVRKFYIEVQSLADHDAALARELGEDAAAEPVTGTDERAVGAASLVVTPPPRQRASETSAGAGSAPPPSGSVAHPPAQHARPHPHGTKKRSKGKKRR